MMIAAHIGVSARINEVHLAQAGLGFCQGCFSLFEALSPWATASLSHM